MTDQDEAVPEGWGQAPLGHLCLINPRSFVKAVDDDTNVSFVPMSAVEADTGNLDSSMSRPYGEVRKGYTRFSEGDVLFAKITPCMENGKIAVAKGLKNRAGCGSTEFHVMRPIEGLTGRLLMYFLLQEAIRREAQGNMTGSAGQLRVPAAFLEAAAFPLPPLAEQHRIVAEIEKQLTRLDASVAALRRAKANLKRYRASVLKDACEGRLVPTEASLARAEGREFEHAGQLLQRILEERRARWESQEKRRGTYKEPAVPDTSVLPTLPEGWVWASGEQLAASIRNGLSQKPEGNHGTPILRISAVRPLSINLEDVRWIANSKDLQDYRIAEGDLLFTRYNGNPSLVGICGVVRFVARATLHPDKLIRVTLIESGAMPEFMQVAANVGESRHFLSRRTRTTAGQSGISGLDLKQMPLPFPPVEEQGRIVAEVERRLSVVHQAEAAVDASLRRAERLRQSVLKRAFEGKLVPQDPDDEPASVLLERIRAEREASQASESKNAAGRRGRGRPSKRKEQT